MNASGKESGMDHPARVGEGLVGATAALRLTRRPFGIAGADRVGYA